MPLPLALSILDSIDSQEAKFKPVSKDPQALGAASAILKFVYNACILTVGTRVFDYDSFLAKEPATVAKPSAKGAFLRPKHLYFNHENQQLQVANFIPATLPVFNVHETLPRHVLRDHFDEVELPDIDLYNYNEVSMARYVPKTSPILKEFNQKLQPKAFEF